jgi:hypothetical protein
MPNLSHLRTFGCIAYAVRTQYKKKLDDRASRYILVGYGLTGQELKVYHLYNQTNKGYVVSRDAIFLENVLYKDRNQDECNAPRMSSPADKTISGTSDVVVEEENVKSFRFLVRQDSDTDDENLASIKPPTSSDNGQTRTESDNADLDRHTHQVHIVRNHHVKA